MNSVTELVPGLELRAKRHLNQSGALFNGRRKFVTNAPIDNPKHSERPIGWDISNGFETERSDVAEALGITQPTVTKHRRVAAKKLLKELFDYSGSRDLFAF